jgi:pimeloyl-ACP methyl ester carboxylesterase
MATVHATVWDEAGPGGQAVVLVHGILAWGSDPVYGFGAQRPLAARYRLIVMDRRGYGASPDTSRSDYEHDADDIAGLLGDGAHLVGHSYGGVAAMVAAARHPRAVRSLTLIQPGCLQVAAGDPAVAATLRANEEGLARLPADLPPARYLRLATESVGLPPLPATPQRLRAAATTMAERPCWQGDLPVADLAAARFPKLVITGTWQDAPAAYRQLAGEALMACARITAERTGAALLQVPGYYPHVQHPGIVNAALDRFWSQPGDQPGSRDDRPGRN